MRRAGGSGLVILAIFLVLLGLVLGLGILQALLTFLGYLLIITGLIVGVIGLIQMLSGNKRRSRY
jgi:hypothetical protein